MGLRETVAAGVEQAFAAAADLVSLGTYTVRTGAVTYDPVLDTHTAATRTYTAVRMLRTTLDEQEREASPVAVSDVKILVPAVDLPGSRPSETDVFTLDGLGYNLTRSRPVPGDSLWIIYGREQ